MHFGKNQNKTEKNQNQKKHALWNHRKLFNYGYQRSVLSGFCFCLTSPLRLINFSPIMIVIARGTNF